MTLNEFLDRLDGSRYALSGAAIRTTSPACACPLEAESGMGIGKAIAAGDLFGLERWETYAIMAAADRTLRMLRPHDILAHRIRRTMLAKIRAANSGKLPRRSVKEATSEAYKRTETHARYGRP